MLADPREGLLGRDYGLSADCGALASEADVAVADYFVNRVAVAVFAQTLAVIDELAHVKAVEANFRPEL